MRFLLIDRMLELESGQRARGVKNVTLSEDLFTHHFPERPLMPGSLLLECMVQLGDLLLREQSDFRSLGILRHVSRLRLRRMVGPGDQVELSVDVASSEDETVSFVGRASVAGAASASAEFSLLKCPLEEFESRAEAQRQFRLLRPRNPFDVE
jgi:3-hydroxyacyl-[acyl-carrier-protein] dehydratase